MDRSSFTLPFIAFAFFNLLDLMLTRMVLRLPGTAEVNPIMAAMFADGFDAAVLLKLAIVALVGLITWLLWPYDVIRKAMFGGIILMAAVVAYQIYGVATHLNHLNSLYRG